MAVAGRKPKPPGEAINRNRPAFEWTEVEDVPFDNPPRLPTKRPGGKTWPHWALRKWRVWRRMPHAKLWTDSDWEFVFDSVEVAARFYETGTTAHASELRTRERLLGTTADFRRDLRIRYVDPKPEQPMAVVVSADDYRDL